MIDAWVDIVNPRFAMLSIYIERKLQHTYIQAYYVSIYTTP